ncbi:MAG TPA: Ni/Fe-hydrogenase cytochrome b subunit [Rhodospirillaceae bacterium]|nr:Ni/Fe-hydrogenase cytochrome b subunit [Rhodospirillaceae bacterium]
MAHASPLGGSVVTKTTVIAAAFAAAAAIILAYRFIYGLGAVANISNGYPWGIWIVWDVIIGTAFGCGGYAMALLVYVMNKGEYHPLVRPALTASLFGYSLGGASVIFDLGRYWNAWHIFTPGWINVNSVMFEVAACIGCYVLVLWIEFLPVIAEKYASPEMRKKISKTLYIFIALGVLLPTMHQSSLGSMLVVFGFHIHPLWQTELLPLLFLLSALGMGYSIVIFEATLVNASYRRPSEAGIVGKLGRYMVFLIAAYLVIRWGEIIVDGKLGLVFSSGGLSLAFLLENLLFLIPIILMASEEKRANAQLQFVAAVCLLLGGALYRIDAYLTAYDRPGWHYFPSVSEMLVTIGIIAIEVLAYIVFVKRLPVLHTVKRAHGVAATTNE